MIELDNVKNETILRDFFIFELDNIQNEAILRGIFNFWTWQHQNKAILRDFLQKWKVECSADGLIPMRFAIFPLHLSKVLRLPRKIDARSYEVLHLSRKIILANLQIWCSKMQPVSGNQRPDLLTSLMNMSFVLRLPCDMYLCRSSSNVPRLPSFLEMLQPSRFAHFWEGARSLAPARRNDIWTSKSGPSLWCFVHVWLRNVLRATTACTFSTSQLPKVVCVVHFDFKMCFAPKRRALFRHLNFQKWSEREVFLPFSLANVLRATTFSTSQLPKVVRSWSVLYILAWKCASRHNGVQFFISHLARWLRTRRFSEPTFRPSGATNHWKKQSVSRLSYLSAHLGLLSSDSFSFFFSSLLWLFPSLLFICPYCRKFDF